jgi:hypothetical protein
VSRLVVLRLGELLCSYLLLALVVYGLSGRRR